MFPGRFSSRFSSLPPCFRRWTSGRSHRGDRRVPILVSEAVRSRFRVRRARHPARHRLSHLQHLQRQRPVSLLTLNEEEHFVTFFHLVFILAATIH